MNFGQRPKTCWHTTAGELSPAGICCQCRGPLISLGSSKLAVEIEIEVGLPFMFFLFAFCFQGRTPGTVLTSFNPVFRFLHFRVQRNITPTPHIFQTRGRFPMGRCDMQMDVFVSGSLPALGSFYREAKPRFETRPNMGVPLLDSQGGFKSRKCLASPKTVGTPWLKVYIP